MTTTDRPSRAILEDRYQALIFQPDDDDAWTDLGADLGVGIAELAAGVARVHPDEADDILAELLRHIHERIVGWAAERAEA